MAKQNYIITESLNGEEKQLGSASLENIEQAKGFAEALRGFLLSEIKVKNEDGDVLASKVFEWA
jgi:hypothetical protein